MPRRSPRLRRVDRPAQPLDRFNPVDLRSTVKSIRVAWFLHLASTVIDVGSARQHIFGRGVQSPPSPEGRHSAPLPKPVQLIDFGLPDR